MIARWWRILSHLVSSSVSSAHYYSCMHSGTSQRGVNLTDVVTIYVFRPEWVGMARLSAQGAKPTLHHVPLVFLWLRDGTLRS